MGQYIKIQLIVNCIAAIHGIFLSIILGTKKNNRKANSILAAFVFIFSIGMIGPVYVSAGIYKKLWWLSPFFNMLPYLFGPMIYFYIRALTTPRFGFKKSHLLHALPAIAWAIFYSKVFFLHPSHRTPFLYKVYFQTSLESYTSIFVSLTQILFYILLCLRLFKNHSKKIKQSYSQLEKVNLDWIRYLLILLIITWTAAVGLQSFLPGEMIVKKFDDAVIYFLMSIFIFTIGYRGMSQPELFDPPTEEAQNNKTPVKAKKYEKTGLTPDQSSEINKRLLQIMNDNRLYLDPGLTLPQVADFMNLPVHHLSQVINDTMDRNFYRFINGYRVEEAKKRLLAPDTIGDKLTKIAFDSGFNSLPTFNRVFKDFSGMSPSQFRQQGH